MTLRYKATCDECSFEAVRATPAMAHQSLSRHVYGRPHRLTILRQQKAADHDEAMRHKEAS